MFFSDGQQCNPNPCRNGRCVERVGGFMCQCNPGYGGQRCDLREYHLYIYTRHGLCDQHENHLNIKDMVSVTCMSTNSICTRHGLCDLRKYTLYNYIYRT